MDFSNLKELLVDGIKLVELKINGVLVWMAKTFTNQVPISIDTDKSIFNGVGYIGKTRLSSSGATKESSRTSTTGFIPASSGAVIRVPTEYFDSGACYVCSYNSAFGFVAAVNSGGAYGGGTVVTNGNVTEITLLNNSNIAYIRVSMEWNGEDTGYASASDPTQGPCEYMIVTVNEELPL